MMKKVDKEELHSIFREIKNNKELFFDKLYENYRELVYAIAFSILKNRENSEDVVQKVYLKIWKMEEQKLPRSNEANWLYSLTKNETLYFLKYKKDLLNLDKEDNNNYKYICYIRNNCRINNVHRLGQHYNRKFN